MIFDQSTTVILSNYSALGETCDTDQLNIAAIDLGTNSCRLLVARADESNLKIIDSYSKIIRLGEDIHQTKKLSRQAINRAIDSLAICIQKINKHNVKLLRCVTTEACRQALNAADFIEEVKEKVGIKLEIINPSEEAYLAITGCSSLLSNQASYALAFDIGGGSTELLWMKVYSAPESDKQIYHNIEVIDCISLPFGVVTLSEGYGAHASHPKAYEDTRERILQKLAVFCEKNSILNYVKQNQVQMIGTSGTVTTLAAIFLELTKYERKLIDGFMIETQALIGICRDILAMEEKDRLNHPCIGVERASFIVMGAAILEGIISMWPITSTVIADRGVREGILIDLLHKDLKKRGHNVPKYGVKFL